MLVRGFTPEIQEVLQREVNLFDFKVVRPNLEELYIGFTQPIDNATPPGSRKRYPKSLNITYRPNR